MAKWLLIPIKEKPSGCMPVLIIPGIFVLLMLLGLTGELIQVQILGNTTPIKQRGVGDSFLIGAGVWFTIGLIIFAVRKMRR